MLTGHFALAVAAKPLGPAITAGLQEVKARYDPGKVFSQANQMAVPAGRIPDPSGVSISSPQLGSAPEQ